MDAKWSHILQQLRCAAVETVFLTNLIPINSNHEYDSHTRVKENTQTHVHCVCVCQNNSSKHSRIECIFCFGRLFSDRWITFENVRIVKKKNENNTNKVTVYRHRWAGLDLCDLSWFVFFMLPKYGRIAVEFFYMPKTIGSNDTTYKFLVKFFCIFI